MILSETIGVRSDGPAPSFVSTPVEDSTVYQETSEYEVTISLANSAAVANSNSIAFCLKTEVKDKADNVQIWLGQKIKLDVKTNGDFSTESTLTTTKFDGISTEVSDAGDVTFRVGVERCDANGNKVTDTKFTFFFKNMRDAKISHLGNSVSIQQYIFRFQISMANVVLMEVC